jgi:hypothetical protein
MSGLEGLVQPSANLACGIPSHTQEQWYLQGHLVMYTVLPETIFSLAVAMIGAEEDRGIAKRSEQRSQYNVAVFDAEQLSPLTLSSIVLTAERDARIPVGTPGRTIVPIRNVRLTSIQEREYRPTCFESLIGHPRDLLCKRRAVETEPLKLLRQKFTRRSSRVEKSLGSRTNRPIAEAIKPIDNVSPGDGERLAAFPGKSRTDDLEDFTKFRVQERLRDAC